MAFLSTMRWIEIADCTLADPSFRLLAGILLLMLLTAGVCHWLYGPSSCSHRRVRRGNHP